VAYNFVHITNNNLIFKDILIYLKSSSNKVKIINMLNLQYIPIKEQNNKRNPYNLIVRVLILYSSFVFF